MKCKICKSPTTNKYGDGNCMLCENILKLVSLYEIALNQPNLQGNSRKVKLYAEISRK